MRKSTTSCPRRVRDSRRSRDVALGGVVGGGGGGAQGGSGGGGGVHGMRRSNNFAYLSQSLEVGSIS